jgi:hypothetical protein
LFPTQKERIYAKDEIELRNPKEDNDLKLIDSLSKNITGSLID